MARSQLQKGSQGSDVKYLQEFLNTQGHSLAVDGIFGDKTLAAVKDYQSKNGLTVDGIVGTNTWGSIDKLSAGSGSGSSGSTSANTANSANTSNAFTYKDYAESDAVKNAGTAAQNAANAVANYGSFTYGNEGLYNDVMNKILNREKFSYDFNGDALYQQYKDKYIKQGKMAMGDAIGQASAMTGGYGNSYAQSVGQQAYQANLENLNDMIPELYQMALDKYNTEGQDLYNQFGMLQSDRSQKYGEWSDGYNRALTDRSYYQGLYDSERTYDRGVYDSDRNFAYGQHRDDVTDQQWQKNYDYQVGRDAVEDAQWQKSYDYQVGRDAVSDAQWQKSFDEGVRQFNEQLELQKKNSVGGGGDDPDVDDTPQVDPNSAAIRSFQSSLSPESTHDAIARKMYGPYSSYVALQIYQNTQLSEAEKAYLISYYNISDSSLQYLRDKGYDIK